MNEEWNRIYGDRVEAYRKLALATELKLQIECQKLNLGEREIAEYSHRVKSRKSLEEKATRKGYSNPLDATDIVGVRVVYLYKSDMDRVEQAVLSTLRGRVGDRQIEKVHHADDTDKADDLGYRAIHYVGHLEQSGLDLVDDVPVEIQVRTVGQHAWALLEQGLVYKTKSAVPQHLVRSVLGLSILYELADERFDQLRKNQMEYKAALEKAQGYNFSRTAIDIYSMKIMLTRKHHLDLGVGSEPELSWLLKDLDNNRFKTIGDLDAALTKTLPLARVFLAEKPVRLESPIRERLELTLGLALADPGLIIRGWPQGMSKIDREKLSAIAKEHSGKSGP